MTEQDAAHPTVPPREGGPPSPTVLRVTGALVRGDAEAFERELARQSDVCSSWLSQMLCERLGPTAFRLLARLPTGPGQASAREALRPHYLANWRRNQRHHHQTLDLVATLASRGVDATVLKGTPLGLRLYDSVAGRATGDVDLLVVGEEPFRAFVAALEALGFRGRERPRVSLAVARRFCHHLVLVGREMLLEAHWDLRRHPSFAVDLQRLSSTRIRIGAEGGDVAVLSDEYELVMLLLSTYDDAGRAELGLRPLVDIAVLCRRLEALDAWGAFFAQRQREGLLRLSVNVLALVVGLLDQEPVLPRLVASLREYRGLIIVPGEGDRVRVFDRGRRAWLRNRRWTFALEETSLAASVAWWAVSLPIRLEVYRLPTG